MSNLIFFEIPEFKLPYTLRSFDTLVSLFNKLSKKYFNIRFNKLRKKYPKHRVVFINENNFLNEISIKDADEEAIELTKKTGKIFKTIFPDYDLWDMNQLDIIRSFIRPRYHVLKAFEKLVERENPLEIVITGSGFHFNLIEKLAREKGLSVKKENLFPSINFYMYKKILPFILKKFHHRQYKKVLCSKNQYKKIIIPKGKKKLLIFSSSERTQRHIDWSKPWYEKLKNCDLVFIELSKKSSKFFENSPFYYHLFSEYMDSSLKKKIIAEIKQAKRKFDEVFKSNYKKRLVIYNGINLTECFNDLFVYFRNIAIRDTIMLIEMTKQVIKKEKPDLVVFFGGWRPFPRIISSVLFDNNIKSVLVQHGFYFGESPDVRPLKISKLAVFGPYTKNFLVKKGEEPLKIVVTGQPRFDNLLNKKFDVMKIKKELNMPFNKKIVLYTSDHDCDMEMKELIDVFKQTDFYLILKLHPDQKEPEFANIFKKRENVLLIKNFDIYNLIVVSDIVITALSTTGLEGMIMGKPLIMLNLINKSDLAGYTKLGAAVGVYKKEDILPAVKKILENKEFLSDLKKKMKEHVRYHCYKQDGKASERVAKLIESMINN